MDNYRPNKARSTMTSAIGSVGPTGVNPASDRSVSYDELAASSDKSIHVGNW